MLISYILITLHLQNHNFQRTPLTPSESDFAEIYHEYFKDALSNAMKICHFFF